MFTPDLLTDDQQDAIDRLYNHDRTLLVANMGAGKTVVTLTAIKELLDDGVINRVLVFGTLKICQSVWPVEVGNWTHLEGLTVANAAGGSAKQRIKAIESGAQIVCINFENIPWLFRTYKAKGLFDALLVDEITKLKNTGTASFKALRPRLNDFKWVCGMTGTVVSEDWEGLFGQMLVVDKGEALGTRKDGYLRRYFYPTDYNEYNWEMYDWAPAEIAQKIKGVVYTMPDYRHELPPLDDQPLVLTPPPELMARYGELKASMATELAEVEVVAETAAVLSGKLQQCTNGFLYGPTTPEGKRGLPHYLSDYKIEAARAYIDGLLAEGRPVIVCYWFTADLDRLRAVYPGSELNSENIDRWNVRDLDVMLLHPKSAGHGLNLARGGADMLFIGEVWSRDVREQTIARLWRRGQKDTVTVRTLTGDGMIDGLMRQRVDGKAEYEELFKRHVMGV